MSGNYKLQTTNYKTRGFTLVELIVAITVFAAVVVIGIGGIARILRLERQSVEMLASNSNISLVMEQMSREIRTGRWFCHTPQNPSSPSSEPDTAKYCATIGGLTSLGGGFEESSALAFYAPNGATSKLVIYCSANGGIEISTSTAAAVCGDSTFSKITADSVNVSRLNFVLFGNEYNDGYPPRVTISLEANPVFTDTPAAGSLIQFQSTVSARLIDT